jgi:hypothetical protein
MEAVLLAVTLVSLAIAIGASVLAWRVMRNDRLRSEARIAALAADLGIDEDERPVVRTARAAEPVPAVEIRTADEPGGIFAQGARAERSGFRFAAGLGVAALLVAAVIGTLVLTSRGTTAAPPERATASAAPAAAPPAAEVPLELIALGHEREADRLTVRGVVRGPASSSAQGPLTAVVSLFDRDGTLIATGRGTVQSSEVAPSGERRFVVTVLSAGNVGRYRVSFRSDDHIVPHIDRRAQPGTLSSDTGTVKSQV